MKACPICKKNDGTHVAEMHSLWLESYAGQFKKDFSENKEVVFEVFRNLVGLGFETALQLVERHLGEEALLELLLGFYKSQVNNGGHFQYYENGYPSGKTGMDDIIWHDKMVALYEKYRGKDDLYEIMERFQELYYSELAPLFDTLKHGDNEDEAEWAEEQIETCLVGLDDRFYLVQL